MRDCTFFFGSRLALAIFSVALLATSAWAADHEKVLHSLGGGTDGIFSLAGLKSDSAGNLYGTTFYGGIHEAGTVFELSPREGGGWTERVLHSFGNGTDGQAPLAGLVFDSSGNLYGTTEGGGIHGAGTAFELSPNGTGGWTETVLHSFGGGTDGAYPYSTLIFDTAGNLYGTTNVGGIHDSCGGYDRTCGTVFELSPKEGGGWTETVLHSFNDNGQDGWYPDAGLVLDAAGNLYGITGEGGIHGGGTAFELSPRAGGGWTETVLHSFGNRYDGAGPTGLVLDAAGNLYGTTYSGGILSVCEGVGCGTVFELSPNGSGNWTEKVLHDFGHGIDGRNPYSGVILDGAGNLYGTTDRGGIHSCSHGVECGTVFELSPNGSGGWTETVLHSFGKGTDGTEPVGGLILDASGNLYGTTSAGGIHDNCDSGCGTVFELSP